MVYSRLAFSKIARSSDRAILHQGLGTYRVQNLSIYRQLIFFHYIEHPSLLSWAPRDIDWIDFLALEAVRPGIEPVELLERAFAMSEPSLPHMESSQKKKVNRGGSTEVHLFCGCRNRDSIAQVIQICMIEFYYHCAYYTYLFPFSIRRNYISTKLLFNGWIKVIIPWVICDDWCNCHISYC